MRWFKQKELPPLLQRIRLEPGDVLVVKYAKRLSPSQADDLKRALEPKFTGHEILVVGDPDITFSVITPAPQEAAA